ncbi:MAG TPA: hypothetical protein VGG42_01515 [Acidobacteriaceae bacterium]|jgi:hypothetical protein
MRRSARYAFQTILLGIVLEIFWIACVSNLKPHEMIVGIPATLLSVAFCLFTVHKLPLKFRPTLAELAEVWRLPLYAAVDLTQIVWVLLKDLAGRPAPSLFRSVPWRENAATGRATARRVLATSYTTVSPNFIVLGIDCQQGQILFHQLTEAPVPAMTQRFGAGEAR